MVQREIMKMRNAAMLKKMQRDFIVEVGVVAELIDRPSRRPSPAFERAERIDRRELGPATLRISTLREDGYLIAQTS